MLQMGSIGDQMQCTNKAGSLESSDKSANGNGACFDGDFKLAADQMPITQVHGSITVSQARKAGRHVKPKKQDPLHGKHNHFSVPGIHMMKLDRCWSSDDVGMAFKAKYNRTVTLDFDHEIQSKPAKTSLLYFPTPHSSTNPLPIADAQVQVHKPGRNGSYSRDCEAVIMADVVSVHPAVKISSCTSTCDTLKSSSIQPDLQHIVKVEDNKSGSNASCVTLPVPFIRSFGRGAENTTSSDSESGSAQVQSVSPNLDHNACA
jgi:hypothetical protein